MVTLAPLLLAVAASPLLVIREQGSLLDLRYGIRAERVDGQILCSVQANDAPLRPLLEILADRAGITIDGVDRIPSDMRVTAHLERRPLTQVAAWVLGSVGLCADRRKDALTLRVDGDTLDDLWTQGQTSYLRTLREHPNHERADRAVLGQALLEEDRGNASAARAHLDGLVEAYPESSLVPEALKRCAEMWAREREWGFAAQKWAALLRLEREHPHELLAYTELARSTAHLGDAERALHMLDALENLSPAIDDHEEQERLYIRARALVGMRRYPQALEALDRADHWERSFAEELVSLELRGLALEGVGNPGDASRAWLGLAQSAAEQSDRAEGLRRAAVLALEAGDEIGVLFVEQLAANLGAEEVVAEAAREARLRLGLQPDQLTKQSAVERLARAERLLAAGLMTEAGELLDSIRGAAEVFDEDEATRFTLALGRALAGGSMADGSGADRAVLLFRKQLEWLETPENRRRVYVLAAELYEAEGRFDEAIDAYQGRL